jgi:TPP-dependent 2-oxoacid decarboxylase
MEVSSDVAYLDVEIPEAPLVPAQPPKRPGGGCGRVRAAIAARLSDATSPAILADQDVGRSSVAAEIMELAAIMQIPVAVTGPAKAVIDETFPYYAGVAETGCRPMSFSRARTSYPDGSPSGEPTARCKVAVTLHPMAMLPITLAGWP